MANDGSAQSRNIWPIPKFYFVVTIGGTEIMFQEVTGLSTETQPIEYRSGNNKIFSPIQMPGIKKHGSITLKKGVFKGDETLWSMYSKVKLNTPEKETITISLLDEEDKITMSWTLANAYPTKITATDMKADANEVAIETMELTHEGLEISNS